MTQNTPGPFEVRPGRLLEGALMTIDPMRVMAFLHVVLFAYWIGADLGVMLTSLAGSKAGASEDAKRRLREAWALIDMAPRTCLVLMVPVGLTLAERYGSPITGGALGLVWIASLAWVWLVWMVHLKEHSPLGKLFWRIDFAIRTAVMLAFVAFGAWCLVNRTPIAEGWLAAKFLLFGVTIFLGLAIRVMLLAMLRPTAQPAPAATGSTASPPFWSPLRLVVFGIWGLVFVLAFLGVVKPF